MPVVEPTPTTAVSVPAGAMIVPGLAIKFGPVAFSRAAVANAVPAKVTDAPAAALASEADAPEIVCAEPDVGVTLYCKVDAVPSLAVAQIEVSAVIRIGPPAIVNKVRPLLMTAAALRATRSCRLAVPLAYAASELVVPGT